MVLRFVYKCFPAQFLDMDLVNANQIISVFGCPCTYHQPIKAINLCIYSSVVKYTESIPVSERSKARVCGRSSAGIAGSDPAGGMGVCCVL